MILLGISAVINIKEGGIDAVVKLSQQTLDDIVNCIINDEGFHLG